MNPTPPTPRTDAAEIDLNTHVAFLTHEDGHHEKLTKYVPSHVARQLETELTTLRTTLEQTQKVCGELAVGLQAYHSLWEGHGVKECDEKDCNVCHSDKALANYAQLKGTK